MDGVPALEVPCRVEVDEDLDEEEGAAAGVDGV